MNNKISFLSVLLVVSFLNFCPFAIAFSSAQLIEGPQENYGITDDIKMDRDNIQTYLDFFSREFMGKYDSCIVIYKTETGNDFLNTNTYEIEKGPLRISSDISSYDEQYNVFELTFSFGGEKNYVMRPFEAKFLLPGKLLESKVAWNKQSEGRYRIKDDLGYNPRDPNSYEMEKTEFIFTPIKTDKRICMESVYINSYSEKSEKNANGKITSTTATTIECNIPEACYNF